MSKLVDWYITSDNLIVVDGLRREVPVSSITQSGGTATVTAESHGLSTGDVVRIEGCDQDDYNGNHTITVSGDTFTFSVPTGTASPATGDIECGAYLDDATVTVSISDQNNIAFDYKTGSNGVYVGTVPDTTALTEGTSYTATITATASTGEVLTIKQAGKAKYYGA